MLIVLLASPQQVASLCSPSLLSHLAGLRLLQLRMEKEELEEELGEKIEALQRELGQARTGAGETRQVEELKKVLGGWGTAGQVGVMGACLTHPRGPSCCLPRLCFQTSSCLLSLIFPAHTPAALVSSFTVDISNGKNSPRPAWVIARGCWLTSKRPHA